MSHGELMSKRLAVRQLHCTAELLPGVMHGVCRRNTCAAALAGAVVAAMITCSTGSITRPLSSAAGHTFLTTLMRVEVSTAQSYPGRSSGDDRSGS